MAKITVLNVYSHLDDGSGGSYYVEAKPNIRWVTVGGPFPTRDKAAKFAHDYAVSNHVATRVVTNAGD